MPHVGRGWAGGQTRCKGTAWLLPRPPHSFPADTAAWARLWAQTQLKLRVNKGTLSYKISAPCDISAELMPCWRPDPAGPCTALPQLRQATLPVSGSACHGELGGWGQSRRVEDG